MQSNQVPETADVEVGSVFLNLGNCGISFSIVDGKNGPTVVIRQSSFGNLVTTTEIFTDNNSIKGLANLFEAASYHQFKNKPYCHKARTIKSFSSDFEEEVAEECFSDCAVKVVDKNV